MLGGNTCLYITKGLGQKRWHMGGEEKWGDGL